MFPLIDGKLFRINKDGMNGDPIQVNKPQLEFGTSPLYDYHIKDIDPANELACVIITDELGRIQIVNKSAGDIYLNDKAVPKNSARPLLTNNIIKMCDGVEFLWINKNDKENLKAELNDADFASWSDPAKKNMKHSKLKTQRPKGRLTAHPLQTYSTAMEDIANSQETPATSNDEQDTGCTVIPTDEDEPIAVPPQSTIESQALINFSANESQLCVSNEPTDTNSPNPADDLMKFDEQFDSKATTSNTAVVKTMPSDCSVITLSSEESQEAPLHGVQNESVEFKNEDIFRAISRPPSELQDDLFDDSADDETENKQIDNAATVAGENEVKRQDETIETELTHNKDKNNSMQESNMANLSTDNYDANDDDYIPETQDIFSQESNVSLNSTNATTEPVQSQSNLSILSISSSEDQEITQIQITDPNKSQIDEIHPNVAVKLEEATPQEDALHHENEVKSDEHANQSNAEFNESGPLFSQDLIAEFDDSQDQTNESHSNSTAVFDFAPDSTIGNFLKNTQQPESNVENLDEFAQERQALSLNETVTLTDLTPMQQDQANNVCANINELLSTGQQLLQDDCTTDETQDILNEETETNDINVSVATSSASVCGLLNDTTQELNLMAFSSEIDNAEEMDKLEFTSSESNDSGNMTANASCANTADTIADSSQTNSFTSKSDEDISMAENNPNDTNSKLNSFDQPEMSSSDNETDVIANSSDVIENTEIQRESIKSPSNHVELNEPVTENNDIDSPESPNNMSSLLMSEESIEPKVITNEEPQDNVVSTSNDNELVDNIDLESTLGIVDPTSISTPAKALTKSIDCRSSVRSVKKKPFDAESFTPRRTPRKLNVSMASATPSRYEISSSTKGNEQVVEETQSEIVSESIPLNDENIVQNVESDELIQNDQDAMANATPAKMGITVESKSTVNRSTRRNRGLFQSDSGTPKITAQKLDINSVQETPKKSHLKENVNLEENCESDAVEGGGAGEGEGESEVHDQNENPEMVTLEVEQKHQLTVDTPQEAQTEDNEQKIESMEVDEKDEHLQNNSLDVERSVQCSEIGHSTQSSEIVPEFTTPKVENVIDCQSTAPIKIDDSLAEFVTPAKMKNVPECKLTTPRSTRRNRTNLEITSNISVVQNTPQKSNVEKKDDASEEKFELQTGQKELADEPKKIEDNVAIESEPTVQCTDNEPEQMNETIPALTTPAKAVISVECKSTATRSTRRNRAPIEANTKAVPKKLNISQAVETQRETQIEDAEEQIDQMILAECTKDDEKDEQLEDNPLDVERPVQCSEIEISTHMSEMVPEFATPKVEEVIECQSTAPVKVDDSLAEFITPAKMKNVAECPSTTPRSTRRNRTNLESTSYISVVQNTPQISNVEKKDDASEEKFELQADEKGLVDEPKKIEDAVAIESEPTVQSTDNETISEFTTPAKAVISVECKSTATRSTRRNRAPIEANTPKMVPKKLNTSQVVETPQKTQNEDSEEQINQMISTESMEVDEKVEQLEDNPLDVQCSEVEHSTQKSEIVSEFATPKVEEVIECESTAPVKIDDSLAEFVTPAKIKNVTECKLTTPRSTRRNRTNLESTSNISVVQNTPQKSNVGNKDDAPEEKFELEADEKELADETKKIEDNVATESEPPVQCTDNEPEQKNETIPALTTPAKAESSVECKSTDTRSTRRNRAPIEANTPKTVPKNLNISQVDETQQETQIEDTEEQIDQMISTQNESADVQLGETQEIPQTPEKNITTQKSEEKITSPVDENELVDEQPDNAETSSIDVEPMVQHNEQLEQASDLTLPAQVNCTLTELFKTPARVNAVVDGKSTAPRSTRRNRTVLHSETSTLKMTPVKLEVSVAQKTPQMLETNENTEIMSTKIESTIEQVGNTICEEYMNTEPTQNESEDDIPSTPIPSVEPQSFSSAVKSSRRKQLHYSTPIVRQSPRKTKVRFAHDTPLKFATPIQKQDESIANCEPITKLASEIESVQLDETMIESISFSVFSTPAQNKVVGECKTTANHSINHNQNILEIEASTSKTVSKQLNMSIAQEIPQKPEMGVGDQLLESEEFDKSAALSKTGEIIGTKELESPVKNQMDFEADENVPNETVSVDAEANKIESTACNENASAYLTPKIKSIMELKLSTASRSTRRNQKLIESEMNKLKIESTKLNISQIEHTTQQAEIDDEKESTTTENDLVDGKMENAQASQLDVPDKCFEIEQQTQINETVTESSTSAHEITCKLDISLNQEVVQQPADGNNIDEDKENFELQADEKELIDEPMKIEDAVAIESEPTVQCTDNEPEQMNETIPALTTPAKAVISVECKSTATRSTRRNRAPIEANTPKMVPKKLNTSQVVETPQETQNEDTEEQINQMISTESKEVDEHLEDNPLDVERPVQCSEIEISTQKFETPKVEKVIECKSTAPRSTRRARKVLGNETGTPKIPSINFDSSAVQETPQKVNIEDIVVEQVPAENVEQVETVEPKCGMASLSTPISNVEPKCDSSIVKSTRLKQLQLDTPTARQSPRKVISKLGTPSKVLTAAIQVQKINENNIDDASIPIINDRTTDQMGENEYEPTTPAKIDNVTECKSTTSRSTRRNRNINISEAATPKVASNESDFSIVSETPQKSNMINETDAIEKSVVLMPEHFETVQSSGVNTLTAESNQNDDAIQSTPITNVEPSCSSTVIRSTRRKQLQFELGTPTARQSPRKTDSRYAKGTPIKLTEPFAEFKQQNDSAVNEQLPEMATELASTVNEPTVIQTVEPINSETSAIIRTPTKMEPPMKCNSAVSRSTKRKQDHLDTETPTAKRTLREVNATKIIPDMSTSTFDFETNVQDKIAEMVTESESIDVKNDMDVPAQSVNISVALINGNVDEKVENERTEAQPDKKDLVNESNNKGEDEKIQTQVLENSSTPMTVQEHKRVDTPELLNKYRCNVGKVLLARIGTPEMRKLTRSYSKASPMPEMPTIDAKIEVETDHVTTAEIVVLTPIKPSEDITSNESRISTATRSSRRKKPIVETEEMNTATPSTSKTPVSALRKRGKGALANKSDSSAVEQTIAVAENVENLTSMVDEKMDTKTNVESIKKAAGSKRVGTPLPANKKRAFLVGTSKLLVDSDMTKETESNSEPKEKPDEMNSDSKPENDDKTSKTSRGRQRKKVTEAIVSTPTEKEVENSGTPLKERIRNVKAAASEESGPGTSEQMTVQNETNDSKVTQNAAVSAKATRRKRANTELEVDDEIETTPKKAKVQHNVVLSIASEATPSSSRSLRRRAHVVSNESSSVATPKKTRQPRKRNVSEHKTATKTGVDVENVETKTTEEQIEPQIENETNEKSKRKPRQKAAATIVTASASVEVSENVVEDIQNKKSKRTTKRSKSAVAVEATESVFDEVDVKKPKRTTKRTKEDVAENEKVPNVEAPIEIVDDKKPKRGTKRTKAEVTKKTDEARVETQNTENSVETLEEENDHKKPKRSTKRTAKTDKTSEQGPIVEITPIPPTTGRRTRKNTENQPESQSVSDPVEKVDIVDLTDSPMPKPKRGRAKKVAEEKAVPVETVEELPKKRTLRAQSTATKSKDIEPKVPSEEQRKTKPKRTRKAEAEKEEEQPAPKRTRNTKKTKEAEVATNDADTPPIAKRTRRHK